MFGLITMLVGLGVLRPLDHTAALAAHHVSALLFDMVATFAATAVAFESSLVYASIASVVLRRLGYGRWSILPFSFLLLTAIEVSLKLTLQQPGLPTEFIRHNEYFFMTMSFQGTYPSGHAVRSSFLGVLVALLLWRRGGVAPRLAALAAGAIGIVFGLSRVYLGQHWMSDVVAGMALGATGAIPTAALLVGRKIAPSHRSAVR